MDIIELFKIQPDYCVLCGSKNIKWWFAYDARSNTCKCGGCYRRLERISLMLAINGLDINPWGRHSKFIPVF